MEPTRRWQKSIYEFLDTRGCRQLNDYLEDVPGVTYLTFAKEWGLPVSALHLSYLQIHEALQIGRVRWAAMDSLVRSLCRWIPTGWNADEKAEFRRSAAYSHWILVISNEGQNESIDRLGTKAWEEIKAASPPATWCPSTPEDLLLVDAFDRGWPVGAEGDTAGIIGHPFGDDE